jgi:hypothetical protein
MILMRAVIILEQKKNAQNALEEVAKLKKGFKEKETSKQGYLTKKRKC